MQDPQPDGGESSQGGGAPDFVPLAAVEIDDAGPGSPSTSPERMAPEGTALVAINSLDLAFSAFKREPLSKEERANLQRDLVAVLYKHNVPDLPIAEELALATTTVAIIVPRLRRKLKGQDADDRSSTREEGEREDYADPEAGMDATPGSAEAHNLVP